MSPRVRKSLEEHRLTGTKPEWSATDAPIYAGGRPKMPADLSPVADAEWRRLTRELRKRGTLTRVDSSALEIYCKMFARWKLCIADVEKNGPVIASSWLDSTGIEHTKRIENPASKIANRLENSMRQMLREFSATPLSRDKTRPAAPAKKKDEEKPVDEFEQLMQRKDDLPEETSEVDDLLADINVEGDL